MVVDGRRPSCAVGRGGRNVWASLPFDARAMGTSTDRKRRAGNIVGEVGGRDNLRYTSLVVWCPKTNKTNDRHHGDTTLTLSVRGKRACGTLILCASLLCTFWKGDSAENCPDPSITAFGTRRIRTAHASTVVNPSVGHGSASIGAVSASSGLRKLIKASSAHALTRISTQHSRGREIGRAVCRCRSRGVALRLDRSACLRGTTLSLASPAARRYLAGACATH
jgi:hypothetical protein